MKHIVIVSPHFPPSNLVGAQRARFFGSYLKEFEWNPTIVTVHEKFYEEKIEPDLLCLLPAQLRIEKAWAFRRTSFGLIGDIGIRGFWGMYHTIKKIHREQKIDFLYISIPSNYAALLGILMKNKFGIPYGIDYQDPWKNDHPSNQKIFGKAWWSQKLACILEPIALKKVAFISGVAESYYQPLFKNYSWLKNVQTQAIPFGIGEMEFDYLEKHSRNTYLFQNDKMFHMIYAGAMLPKAYAVLDLFFQALVMLKKDNPLFHESFRLHFVGTGKSTDDLKGHNIEPLIKKYNLENCVSEYPNRMPYLDVLNHLKNSSGILILGSTEKHYTPSKIFQAMMVKKPLFALLHEESTAVSIIRDSNTGKVVTLREELLPQAKDVAKQLENFISQAMLFSNNADWSYVKKYSAKELTKILAHSIDKLFEDR